jgi:hypothetical protein
VVEDPVMEVVPAETKPMAGGTMGDEIGTGGAMTGWKNQRGDVPVGCLLGFVVLVLIAIFAMNAGPAQLKLGEFEKRIEELASRANRREYNNERIKRDILAKAQDLDFDVPEENVEIDRNEKRIKIRVHFVQVIRLPGYEWRRPQDIRLELPIF